MTNTDPVFSIQQGDYLAPIGAKSDNIYITDANGSVICNLTEFFEEWQAFKENARFLQYGTATPGSSRVKLWYQTQVNPKEDDISFIPEENKIAKMTIYYQGENDEAPLKYGDLPGTGGSIVYPNIQTYKGQILFSIKLYYPNGQEILDNRYNDAIKWTTESSIIEILNQAGSSCIIAATALGEGNYTLTCQITDQNYISDTYKNTYPGAPFALTVTGYVLDGNSALEGRLKTAYPSAIILDNYFDSPVWSRTEGERPYAYRYCNMSDDEIQLNTGQIYALDLLLPPENPSTPSESEHVYIVFNGDDVRNTPWGLAEHSFIKVYWDNIDYLYNMAEIEIEDNSATIVANVVW